jgi:hypothetical protein
MADEIIHIVDDDDLEAYAFGLASVPKALCGAEMPSNGVDGYEDPLGSPLCEECYRLSGWTEDNRSQHVTEVWR